MTSKATRCSGTCWGRQPRAWLAAMNHGDTSTRTAPGDASQSCHCQGGDGAQTGSALVLDVAARLGLRAVEEVRFARGVARPEWGYWDASAICNISQLPSSGDYVPPAL
jgi:hypothetical protein